MGLKLTHNPDGTIHIYQPPGDKNALGRIRFNFPNKFLVYQHDTPDKYMFAYDKRAFSHGCMRVQDPQHYAEVLLSLVRPGDGYTEDRIKKMIASTSETDIQFPTFIPVNLTYQTAFVDDAGKLEFRDDIYGRDKALLAILKGDDRKVADIPVEHKVDVSHREVLAIPDQPSLFGGRSYFRRRRRAIIPAAVQRWRQLLQPAVRRLCLRAATARTGRCASEKAVRARHHRALDGCERRTELRETADYQLFPHRPARVNHFSRQAADGRKS